MKWVSKLNIDAEEEYFINGQACLQCERIWVQVTKCLGESDGNINSYVCRYV